MFVLYGMQIGGEHHRVVWALLNSASPRVVEVWDWSRLVVAAKIPAGHRIVWIVIFPLWFEASFTGRTTILR